ncbi:MAG: LysR family transcriptional regulator [Deltaproteobacteria bacterium]|nr:LysR family transcriptional regulator [Deltaproteobacteria bacterium]
MQVDISYSRLKTFYYVATNRSFKTAALKLSVTEGAVSQAIKDLESKLETRLFDRSSRSVNLTAIGQNLFAIVAPVIEQLDHVVEEFEESKGRIYGKVKVASFEVMLLTVFPQRLNIFNTTYPECEVILYNTSGQQLRSMVTNGDVDFGIGSLNNLPDDIIGEEILQCDRCLITPLRFFKFRKKRVTLDDIAQHSIVVPDEGGSGGTGGKAAIDKLRAINPNLKVSMEAAGWHVVMKYVELGFGISFLPEIALQQDHKSLFCIPVSHLIGNSRYGILLKRGKYHSPAARKLMSFFLPDFDPQSK